MPCPLTWHSARVATSAATPILCRKNAATPRVARQWVRPRSSAMSIDVALSKRRGVDRDTYFLPKKNAAAPRCHVNGHGTTKLRSRCHVYRFRFCNVDTFSARRYNINSTSVGITKAIGKDYAESGLCCSMYCTYERGRIRLN